MPGYYAGGMWVSGYWGGPTPPPTRTVTVNTTASGEVSLEWDNTMWGGAKRIIPIEDQYTDIFQITAKGGAIGTTNTATMSRTFSYPHKGGWYGIFGRDTIVIIRATSDVGAKAEKEVVVRAMVVPEFETNLIK